MSFQPLPLEAASRIAAYSITPKNQLYVEEAQAAHRINLVNQWQIPQGSRVLEIGCGQGTCTAVLAEAVGPDGRVDAIDPGSPDYGAPFTLGQAQAHLSASKEIGDRIAWHNDDPVQFLQRKLRERGQDAGGADDSSPLWTHVVLAHCAWYFDSPSVLDELFSELQRHHVRYINVAEYGLRATDPAAAPHVLAAVTRAALEAHNPASTENIRCMLSPDAIKALAAKDNRWRLVNGEAYVVPDEGLLDGHWEATAIARSSAEAWDEEIVQAGHADSRIVSMLQSGRVAVVNAVAALRGKRVKTMDVWVATFVEY